MRILIAEAKRDLGMLWKLHLQRAGLIVDLETGREGVTDALQLHRYDALIMNLDFPEESVLGLTDLATYRNPDIAILVLSSGTFFSEGSVFDLIPNARGCYRMGMDPNDLTEIVKHIAA